MTPQRINVIIELEGEAMIRKMQKSDMDKVLNMMRVFYSSDAVSTNGSEEIFRADIEACISGSPYLEGYVFEEGEVCGYAMLAKSFSTEFGKPCVWIEDLYIEPEFRGRGIGAKFFEFIFNKFTDCVFLLEVEKENKNAIHLYEKCGFENLPYTEMIKKSRR